MTEKQPQINTSKSAVRKLLRKAPWYLIASVFRLLYDFRVEGEENIPNTGPFILAVREPSLIGLFASGWLSIEIMQKAFKDKPYKSTAYLLDQLFTLSYFKNLQNSHKDRKYAPLIPHSAGRMALSLVDGYRSLKSGGIVTLNPEGDGPWDGRPLPVGTSIAWLAIHSGAPVLPTACSIGAYEIWPRWQARPSFRGRLAVRIGQPILLSDTPKRRISDADLETATECIRKELERLSYGTGGVKGWIGPIIKDGGTVKETIKIKPIEKPNRVDKPLEDAEIPVKNRGIAQLLWRCPACRTNDALFHKHPLSRKETLYCQVCGTRWDVQRLIGNDFRLKVIEGPGELVGLDMPLSIWYDEMKRDFKPSPIQALNVELHPGEEVYLEVKDTPLQPYRPSYLFETWTDREAPQSQPPIKPEPGDWDSIGNGRLLLTSHRLLWQGPNGELDFNWSSISAVYLWIINTLGIRYGNARYRMPLGLEVGLKWLTYTGTLARQVAEQQGKKITVTPY